MPFDPNTLLKPPTTSAFGYAVQVNGEMALETVSGTANNAAYKAFWLMKKLVPLCSDPGCDCLVQLLVRTYPRHKIEVVRVNINVDTDPRKS